MKLLVGTAILCMLATAPVYAQQNNDNKQEEPSKTPEKHAEKPASKSSKPPKQAPETTKSAPRHQDEQQQQAKQEQKQNEQEQKQAGQQAKAEHKAQQNNEKAQQQQAKNQEKQQQQAEREAKNQQHDHQTANHGHAETANNAPPGNRGEHRIPEDRYRADFGRAHTFHVRHDDDRRFQFGGYWFQYTDAWPSDWGYDDDFYIVEIDGVDYLCDARFPDQRIVVVIAG